MKLWSYSLRRSRAASGYAVKNADDQKLRAALLCCVWIKLYNVQT